MLDHADFTRLVRKLGSVEDIEAPTFPPGWRPAGRHSESGLDCTVLSRAGLTKKAALTDLSGTRHEGECCPCGALRHIINNTPERDWGCINRYFDDPARASTAVPTEPPEDHNAIPPPQEGTTS